MEIGTIEIVALTLALTEALKSIFNVQGKWNRVVSLVIGIVLTSISYGISNGLVQPEYIPYIEWFVISIAGGLGAIGLFDFASKELPKALKDFVDMFD